MCIPVFLQELLIGQSRSTELAPEEGALGAATPFPLGGTSSQVKLEACQRALLRPAVPALVVAAVRGDRAGRGEGVAAGPARQRPPPPRVPAEAEVGP